jgi:hypothetical protein
LGYLRTDVISIFDVDFRSDSIGPAYIEALGREAGNPPIDALYDESYSWVYYGSSLPGCRRFNYPPPEGIPGARAASLLVNPVNGAAVYSVWQSFGGGEDPLRWKQEAWDMEASLTAWLRRFHLEIKEIERQYPFVAVRVDRDDVAAYCSEHALELGRLFTGNFERDEDRYLLGLIEGNISRRDYERLFMRWTDVLAVYGERVGDEDQEKTMLRAVQVYETCILVRRILRNLADEADRLSSRLSRLPVPWVVDRVSRQFLRIESQFIVAPPVQSVEAERLLRAAYESFGIGGIVEGARNSINFLDRRFQWSKTQFLVALGVLTYLLDKLKVFDTIARWLGLG